MTVAQRLYLLVASAAAGLLGLTFLCYSEIGAVFTSANFANDDTVPALEALGDLRKNFLGLRIELRTIVEGTGLV